VAEAKRYTGEHPMYAEQFNLMRRLWTALEVAQRPPVGESGEWRCKRCGQLAPEHAEAGNTCIWEPAWIAQRPPVSPVLDAINDAREAVARGERPSIIIDTDDYPAPERPPV